MSTPRFPSLRDQREYWDERWRETKTVNEWSLKRGRTILGLLRSLPLDKPRILDLGCGTGWFTEQLSHFGQTTGIDLSEAAIAMARSRYPGVEFRASDLFEIDLPAGHFDVVVSQEVVAHVENQVAYLDRVARILKPQGYLILSTANKFVMDRLGPLNWTPQPSSHIEQYLDMRVLTRLLRPHFLVLRKQAIIPIGQGGILRIVNSYRVNRLLGLIIARQVLDALKERLGFGYTLVVLARKKAVER